MKSIMATTKQAVSFLMFLPFTLFVFAFGCSHSAIDGINAGEVINDSEPQETDADVFDVMQVINKLSGEEIGARPAGVGSNKLASEYIASCFEELGLEYFKGESFICDYEQHAVTTGTVGNVVGIVKGTDNTNAVVISAHFDTVANTPGAVDNASGIATILYVAYEIKSQPEAPKTDIIFCAFNEEEIMPLYFGSRAFVEEIDGLYTSVCNINIDCVGLINGGDYMLGYAPDEISADLIGRFHKILDDMGIGYGSYPVSGVRSDHVSFLKEGIPSICFTQSGIGAVSHRSRDTASNVDAGLINELSDAITRFLLTDGEC